ncbi:MAG TPA: serine hydrolase [Puia sp.]
MEQRTIEFNKSSLQYCPACPIGTYDQLPSGYFYSSASDMQKFVLHYLNVFNGVETKGLLTKKTLDEMWSQQKTILNKKTSLGLCWWRYDDPAKNINYVFHVGDDPRNSSALRNYPEQNIGIIILSNAYYAEHIVWNNLPDDIINCLRMNGK